MIQIFGYIYFKSSDEEEENDLMEYEETRNSDGVGEEIPLLNTDQKSGEHFLWIHYFLD